MKIGRLRSYWIIILSVLTTLDTCCRAIYKSLTKKINRPWTDKRSRQWARNLLKFAGVTCKVVNSHKVSPPVGRACILMCNHSSIYDIPLGFEAFPECSIRMLAKKELSRIPVFGNAMRAAEYPFINRKNRKESIKDLEYAKQLMQSGIVLWMAPEGTRSIDGKLAPFKKGGFISAIQAEAVIIPIAIRGAFDILPAKTLRFNINRQAEIHIGQVIDAKEYTLEEKDQLRERVYQEIQHLLGEKPQAGLDPATKEDEVLSASPN